MRVVARKRDGHNAQAQGKLELTQKDSIRKIRMQNTEQTRKRARRTPKCVLTVDDVAVNFGKPKLTLVI